MMNPVTLAAALLILVSTLAIPARAARSLEFIHVPAFGQSMDPVLTGRVHGGEAGTQRVALYIRVGNGWWTKPTFAQPLTTIQSDGSWSANIVSSGGDVNATQIAAFLVPASWLPPDVGGDPCVPPAVVAASLASATVVRPNPALRNLHWSGLDWYLKDSAGARVGPGDNYFSDATDQVWVDAQNRLHLRVSNVAGKWQCAEAITYRTLGYGRYVFRAETEVNSLDVNAVLGLFTWADRSEDPNHREIDIEWSRWGNASDSTNAQFVVQPYAPTGHLQRITIPAGTGSSVQQWIWQTSGVAFQALAGADALSWSYPAGNTVSANLPMNCDESVHLNLWLCDNAGPAGGQPVEVVLSEFQHIPSDGDGDGMGDAWELAHGLEPASAADAASDDDGDGFTNLQECLADTDPADRTCALLIASHALTGSAPQITFLSRPDKRYDLEGSDTLLPGSWTAIAADVAGTGTPVTVTLPPASGVTRKFYRARLK